MKKYLAIYYAPAAAMQKMGAMSNEQKQAGMKPWMDWMQKYADNLVDGGAPLMPAASLTPVGKWGGSNKEVTGYSVITAKDDADMKKMFNGHPHLSWDEGCTVEISEFAKM